MVFLWFSDGFPMFFLWFSNTFSCGPVGMLRAPVAAGWPPDGRRSRVLGVSFLWFSYGFPTVFLRKLEEAIDNAASEFDRIALESLQD